MKAACFQTVKGKEQTLAYDPRPAHMRNRPEKVEPSLNQLCANVSYKYQCLVLLYCHWPLGLL